MSGATHKERRDFLTGLKKRRLWRCRVIFNFFFKFLHGKSLFFEAVKTACSAGCGFQLLLQCELDRPQNSCCLKVCREK